MKRKQLALAAFLPGLTFAQGSIQPLPTEFDQLVALSHDGSTVLGYEVDNSDPSYTRFNGVLLGGTGTLTWLDNPPGYDTTLPAAMSANGQAIVGMVQSSSTFDQLAARWDGSGSVTLLDPPASAARIEGISEDGVYAVGNAGTKAARWGAGGTAELLDDFPAVVTSVAYDANADGSVIVGKWGNAIGLRRPFRWVEGSGMTSLPTPAGFTNGTALSVSADGETVLGVSSTSSPARFVIWRWTAAGGVTTLPGRTGAGNDLRFAGADSSATRVIGRDLSVSPTAFQPTVWDADRPAVGFFDFTSARAMAPVPGSTFHQVTHVSGDGHVFAGFAFDASGTPFPWIASEGWSAGIQTTTCVHGVANQAGYVSRLRIDGIPFAAANDVSLRAEELPPGAFTMFIASQTSAPPMIPPGSVGALCLGGSIGRYNRVSEVQAADALGVVTLDLDLTGTPNPGGSTSVLAGQTWHYQGWHRDVAQGQQTANFTSAVNLMYQ